MHPTLSNWPMHRHYCCRVMFATLAIRQNYNVNNSKYCVYHFSTPCHLHQQTPTHSATLCLQHHCVQTCSPIHRQYYFMLVATNCRKSYIAYISYTPCTPLANTLKFQQHFCALHTHTPTHTLKDLLLHSIFILVVSL